MPFQTNLNVSPFFDDYDATKNYYKILFRPGVAVQARELTQIQDILQNQIESMGDNIFVDGTIVSGCNFNYDPQVDYVKVPDLMDSGTPTNVNVYNGLVIQDLNSGLKGKVVSVLSGLESQDSQANGNMNTLFVKYINAGVASNGTTYSTFSASDPLVPYDPSTGLYANSYAIHVANSSFTGGSLNNGPTGNAYSFSITQGIIYKNGAFINVPAQTVIVSPFTNLPNGLTVGLQVNEAVVNSYADTSLNDNAQGFSNYNAPGAARLKVTANLVVTTTSATYANNFFPLVDFLNGQVVRESQGTQYNAIEKEIAARLYDEAGSFLVSPFTLTTKTSYTKTGNTATFDANNFLLQVSPGSGYIQGYHVSLPSGQMMSIPKGLDVTQVTSSYVPTFYGNYLITQEFAGAFPNGSTVQLRDTAAAYVTNELSSIPAAPGKLLGTATVLTTLQYSGDQSANNCQYSVYITNVQLNPGCSINSARSIWLANTGVADIITGLDAGNQVLVSPQNNAYQNLLYPLAHSATKSTNNHTYYYRTVNTSVQFVGSTGAATITLAANNFFPYSPGRVQPSVITSDILVTPATTLVANNTALFNGTVTTNSATNVITGSGTYFLSNSVFTPGDYVYFPDTTVRKVVQIASDTSLVVDQNPASNLVANTYSKAFPANLPVPFSVTRPQYANVDSLSQTLTINLGTPLTSTATASVAYNARVVGANPITKNIQRYNYVYINTATHPNGIRGPWSLGMPDVFKIRAVYMDPTNATVNSTNVTSSFTFDSGQTDAYYGLSQLKLAPNAAATVTPGAQLLVCFDAFVASSNTGFFTVNSYQINDSNYSNTTIFTPQIPVYSSAVTGKRYDLRDCVDFRPYAVSTVTPVVGANGVGANSTAVNPTSSTTFNTFKVPNPNSGVTLDMQYYLGRIDNIVLSSTGQLSRVRGVASETPVPPQAPAGGVMVIGSINIPPYPSLAGSDGQSLGRPDYAVSVSASGVKRYTMADIASIDKRLSTVEYYTTISQLQQQVLNQSMPSTITGQNKFKNAVFVDPLNDFTMSNVQDIEYTAALDPSDMASLMPKFVQTNIQLVPNTASASGILVGNNAVTLNYHRIAILSQPAASHYRNAAENQYLFTGTSYLNPKMDVYYDTSTNPVATTYSAPTTATISLQNPNSQSPLILPTANAVAAAANVNNADASLLPSANGTATTLNQVVIDTNAYTATSATAKPVANFQTDTRLTAYVRPQNIQIAAYGMRPNAQIFVFFNNVRVDQAYCAPGINPMYPSSSDPAHVVASGPVGTPIFADQFGCVYAIFSVPAGTFFTGAIPLELSDIPDTSSQNARTTYSKVIFNAFNSIDPPSLTPIYSPVSVTSSVITGGNWSSGFNVTTSQTNFTVVTGFTTSVDGVQVSNTNYSVNTVTTASFTVSAPPPPPPQIIYTSPPGPSTPVQTGNGVYGSIGGNAANTQNFTPQQDYTTVLTANAGWVAGLYTSILGRTPEVGGLAYWTAAMDNGTLSNTQIVQSFYNSVEYETDISGNNAPVPISITSAGTASWGDGNFVNAINQASGSTFSATIVPSYTQLSNGAIAVSTAQFNVAVQTAATDENPNGYTANQLSCFLTGDPIAQSFTITKQMCGGGTGLFLSSVDVFFQSIDPFLGVTVAIVGMQNGYPLSVSRPLAYKRLVPVSFAKNLVATAPDGTTATSTVYLQGAASPVRPSVNAFTPSNFCFDDPVYLQADQDYAVVVMPDSNNPNYTVWTAQLGGTEVYPAAAGNQITNIPEGGYLFQSTNGNTWTPLTAEALKFNLYATNIQTPAGEITYNNEDAEFFNVTPVSNTAFTVGAWAYQTTANVPGTITITTGSNTVTGNNTSFSNTFTVGQTVIIQGWQSNNYYYQFNTVSSVSNNTQMSLGTVSTVNSNNYSNVAVRVSPYLTNEVLSMTTNTNVIFSSNNQYVNKLTSGQNIIVEGVANNLFVRTKLTVSTVNSNTSLSLYNPYTGTNSANWFAVTSIPPFNTNTAFYAAPPMGVVQSQINPFSNSVYLVNSTANTSNYFKVGGTLVDTYAGSVATISAINDIVVNRFQPLLQTDTPNGTAISAAVSTVQGANNAYAANKSAVLNLANYNYFPSSEAVIASKSNEMQYLGGAKSFSANLIFTSSSGYLTPMVIDPFSIVTYSNILNANSTYENTKHGAALNRYVTKTIQLAPGQNAEDLQVYVDAYWPNNATIAVYAKLISQGDPDTFDSKDWTQLVLTSNNAGCSSPTNRNDIWTFNFGLPSTIQGTKLPGFATVSNTSANLVFNKTTNYSMFVNGSIVQITSKGVPSVAVINYANSTFANLTANCAFTDPSATVQTSTIAIPLNGTANVVNNSYTVSLSNAANYSYFSNGSLVQITSGGIPSIYTVNVANSSFMNLNSYPANTDTSALVSQVDNVYGAFLNQQNNGIVRYISKSGSMYDTYVTWALKVDLLSNNSWQAPRIKDVRAIALSV